MVEACEPTLERPGAGPTEPWACHFECPFAEDDQPRRSGVASVLNSQRPLIVTQVLVKFDGV